MSTQKEVILEMLEPLFEEAENKGLWLRSTYQGFSLSPKELKKKQAEGELIWGPVNWTLINPLDLLQNPQDAADKICQQNQEILRRMREKD